MAVLFDVVDTPFDPLHATRFCIAAQILRVETRIEVKGVTQARQNGLRTSAGPRESSFARGDDAARFCAFLRATPTPNGADCIFMASFLLDRRLYDDLLEARDRCREGRKAA